jgi:hypothetical protein
MTEAGRSKHLTAASTGQMATRSEHRLPATPVWSWGARDGSPVSGQNLTLYGDLAASVASRRGAGS